MTTTSNIHIGLSAWASSHAYTVGNRISSSSNAYQCITAGTSASSGGPTTTAADITDGTAHWKYLSAIDFSTLAGWVSSIPGTLTQPIVGLLWNNGAITTSPSTTFFTLTGHTTTTTNTITLKCAPGESIRDTLAGQATALAYSSTNGVSFLLPSSGGSINYIQINDSNVILSGLQFKDPLSTSNCTILQYGATTGSGGRIEDCIFDGFAQTGGANIVQINTPNCIHKIVNCLIVDRAASSSGAAALGLTASVMTVVNCTLVGTNTPTNTAGYEFQNSTGTAVLKNSIATGYSAATAVHSLGAAVAVDHSLFSAGSLTGTNVTTGSGNLFSKTAANQFTSATTDFRLKVAADALDVASTDTTDIASADDIAGSARPQGSAWDMGCWEFLVSAAVNMPRLLILD